jgi:DNA-binding Lrp family transcriptional regulator
MILFTRKISQNELGKLANMSAGTVSNIIRRIENNEDLETKFMRRNLQLIGKALKIQPEKLIGYLTLEL